MSTSAPSVLLASEDTSLHSSIAKIVARLAGLRLEAVSDLSAVPRALNSGTISLVLLHLVGHTDEQVAKDIVSRVAAHRPGCATLVISDDHRPAQAVQLLKQGAKDYLTRPLNLRRLDYLLDVLTIKARRCAASPESQSIRDDVKVLSREDPFLYGHGEMERIVTQVKAVAPLDTTILLTGETGTGKSRLAKLIHELSPRRSEPFVHADCGVVSWPLLESEMFGHTKGSFTGADSSSVGKFGKVAGGTLMLDEIDAVPLELQSKFLRAVDERVYEPVGGTKQLPLRARLIVATNRSLQEEVAAGRFRSDLYYRINVVSFRLPPLRERREMIPGLVKSFVADVARRQNRTPPVFSAQALDDLQSHDWPGNIRELRNVVERCVALTPSLLIDAGLFPDELRQQTVSRPSKQKPLVQRDTWGDWRQAKRNAEVTVIQEALSHCGNNRSKAARQLGISRVTLYKKLHEYGLF